MVYHLKNKWHTPCFEKLNKLEWIDAFGVTSHGVKVGIRVSDPALIDELRARLPDHVKPWHGEECDTILSVIQGGKVPGSRVRKFHMAYQNHTQIGRSFRMDEVLDRFDAWFNLSVAFIAPRRVFVHAGVVSWRGRAIILPGRTLAGKSTLVSELVRAGATYMSDEYAVLDSQGRVGPWLKPISMRETPSSKQVDVPVAEFGGRVSHRYARPGLMVMTRYEEGATWKPRPMTEGEAIMAMLDNCVGGRRSPKRTLDALQAVMSQVTAVESPRGDAATTARELLALIDRHIDAEGADMDARATDAA